MPDTDQKRQRIKGKISVIWKHYEPPDEDQQRANWLYSGKMEYVAKRWELEAR